MKNILLAGSLVFVFTGCAASNGGGHVVGNSAIPASKAKKLAQAEHTCEKCGKDHKDCACKECGCEACAAKKAAKKDKKEDCGCNDH